VCLHRLGGAGRALRGRLRVVAGIVNPDRRSTGSGCGRRSLFLRAGVPVYGQSLRSRSSSWTIGGSRRAPAQRQGISIPPTAGCCSAIILPPLQAPGRSWGSPSRAVRVSPGFLWLVVGAVLAGAVQDFVSLVASMRRNGRSLPQIAGTRSGRTGLATALAVFFVVVVALAGLAFGRQSSTAIPGAPSPLVMTVPIGFFMGFYLQRCAGRVGEVSAIGAPVAGDRRRRGTRRRTILAGGVFDLERDTLVWFPAGLWLLASVLPVWMLLVPRGYLSSFMKVSVVSCWGRSGPDGADDRDAPRNRLIAGGGRSSPGRSSPSSSSRSPAGPSRGSTRWSPPARHPRCSTRIACDDCYGAMLMESFVGRDRTDRGGGLAPATTFAINTTLSAEALGALGYPVARIQELSRLVEQEVMGRPGGAVSLAVGMASIFSPCRA